MEAIQASTGESRPVVRERRGVAWCPFCDRSRLVATTGPICEGCGVEFVDAVPAPAPVVEEVVAVVEKRRKQSEVVEEPAAEEEAQEPEAP
tara:strand:+ start:1366 stop:1638 length:273 start_codon:yes stop_codon:yes gene_type:complete